MNTKSIVFIFVCIALCPFYYALGQGQEVKIDSLKKVEKVIVTDQALETKVWYMVPSLKWNIMALGNPIVPAASLSFEYPFTKTIGIEVESGYILSYYHTTHKEERFRGFRSRISPKIYFSNKDKTIEDRDLFYLKFTFKYDRASTSYFGTVLDPSQSYQQIQLIKGKFENIGGIVYGGYMTTFGKDRFVLDTSVGLGVTHWEHQPFDIPDRDVLVFGNLFVPEITLPVISMNLQLGYRFRSNK